MGKYRVEFRTIIFKEGEDADKLYLIQKGQVICLKGSKDRLVPIFVAKEGDIIGESAMIEGSSYAYSAVSLGTTDLVEVQAMSFKKVLDNAPGWLSELTSTMINRYQNTASLLAENRIIHSSIISESDYTAEAEFEYKKLLANRTV